MKRTLALLICLFASFLAPVPAFSSFCQFSTSPDGAMTGSNYDIASAYQAADCVVVGRVGARRRDGSQPMTISRIVKAPNAGSLVYTGQPASERPVYEGMRLPVEREFLLLLRMKKTGVYGSVDGESDGCPNVFAVTDGYARLGNQAVSLNRLEHFFESKPDAIAFP